MKQNDPGISGHVLRADEQGRSSELFSKEALVERHPNLLPTPGFNCTAKPREKRSFVCCV